jgi:sorbitol-specific phosphotransferase system component IIBC
MKKAIISIVSATIKLLLLSLICNLVYDWNDLNKVFGPTISYSQWVGIIVIINSITPNGITPTDITNSSKDDKQRS